MNIINVYDKKQGPSIDPCGTPVSISLIDDEVSLYCTKHIVNVLLNNFETSLRLCLVCHNTEVSLIKYHGLVYQMPLKGPGKMKRELSFGPFLILFYL